MHAYCNVNSNLARPAFRHVVNCLLTVMEGIEWILSAEPQLVKISESKIVPSVWIMGCMCGLRNYIAYRYI